MNPSNDAPNIDEEFKKILARKSAGEVLAQYQSRYVEAIAEFDAAIRDAENLKEFLKTSVTCEENRAKQTQLVELISTCYYNISACNEELVNFISLFIIK